MPLEGRKGKQTDRQQDDNGNDDDNDGDYETCHFEEVRQTEGETNGKTNRM